MDIPGRRIRAAYGGFRDEFASRGVSQAVK
jgi:hypothetical protein